MAQGQLRKDLNGLRYLAHLPEHSFIPERPLHKLLTRDRVLTVLWEIGSIPGYRVDDVVNKIMKGGKKVFAILCLLKGEEAQIVHFISHDQFQRSPLDAKIPFSRETLKDIVPDIADEFYTTQWDLAAPVFSRGVVHRELHDSTKLPFKQDVPIGGGGFGDIYEIELYADHQTLDFIPLEDTFRAVRKEFRRSNDQVFGYELELRNMNILNELHHPNIVDLLGSYTFRRKHNLIFRLAPGGDLGTLLRGDRPAAFPSDQSLYRALSRLSSAIHAVHSFTSKSLDLQCIGCHHDLKPTNILVQGNDFILADFGLSRLKEATESSKEEFLIGAGHYLAPECEDFEDGFKKHHVGRSSDIWSFGCIISEILTYMKKSKEGVVAFKAARGIKISHFKTYTFHAGRSQPNPGVTTWLSELESDSTRTLADKLCIELVRSMLAMNPDDRPKAHQVTSKLRLITVFAQIQSTDARFARLDSEDIDSIEADLESRRYIAWKDTFNSITKEEGQWNCGTDSLLNFDATFECLVKIACEINLILSRFETALRPLFNDLRLCLDSLIDRLPMERQEQIRTRIELDLTKSEDLSILHSVQRDYEQSSVGDRIGMLLTIKRMSLLALQRKTVTRPDLHLDLRLVDIITDKDKPFVDHDLGKMKDEARRPKSRVVVEWRRYATHWNGPISDEMIARVETNAELLSPGNKPPGLRALDCLGFFHQPLRHAFGIVYQFPGAPADTFETIPMTLASIIHKTMDTRVRPSLGSRFRLANQLASSVLEFSKVGWMHKAICPHNIAFFPSKRCHPLNWLRDPYIIGFNHSRENEPKAFTEGPSAHNPAVKYQHYQYDGEQSYVQAFDYYSLGLVLLEIGLWKLLDDLTARWRYHDGQELRKLLMERRVALLAHHMGTNYCNAVKACLSVDVSSSQLDFAILVLQSLRKCSA